MRLIYLFSILLLISSCGSIKPTAPTIQEDQPTYSQQSSFISIPIEVDLKNYIKDAEKKVPQKFKQEVQNCEGLSFSYVLDRNPLDVDGEKNNLLLTLSGKYSIKLNYCPKCTDLFSANSNCISPRLYASCGVGESMRRIKISTNTNLTIANNFSLKANTIIKDIVPIDKCEVTLFKVDATEELVKEMKKALTNVTNDIDSKIEKTNIQKDVSTIWKQLNDPISLDEYGFFYLNPKAISSSQPTFSKNKLELMLTLEALPKITLSKTNLTSTPLPNLTPAKNSNDGFQLNLDLKGTYVELNELLKKNINNQELKISKNTIIFDSVQVFGASNKKLNFSIYFSGDKKGILYVTGTPTFNKETQTISFPDLDFDIKTKNVLLKSAKWLLSDLITNKIREIALYNLQNDLLNAKNEVQKQLNMKLDENIFMKSKINSLLIENIIPLKDELLIQTTVSGNVKILIQ